MQERLGGSPVRLRRRHVLAGAVGLLSSAAAPGSSRARSGRFVFFEEFGAVGDGKADDAEAINCAARAALAMGAIGLAGSEGRTYRIRSPIRPLYDLIWDLRGSAIISDAPIYMFHDAADETKVLVGNVTDAVIQPGTTLPLNSVDGLNVGDWVGVRIGDNPYDRHEPRYAFSARVIGIDGLTVFLDWKIPRQIDVRRAAPWNKSVFRLNEPPVNLMIRNGQLIGEQSRPGVEGGIGLRWGRNIVIENIVGNRSGVGDMGAGLVGLMQFCRGVTVRNVCLLSNRNTRNQASLGRMLNFSNCMDVEVKCLVAGNVKNVVGFFESYCEQIRIIDPHIDISAGDMREIFFAVQGSELTIENPTVYTPDSITEFVDIGGSEGRPQILGKLTWRGPLPRALALQDYASAIIDYRGPEGDAWIDLRSAFEHRAECVLSDPGQKINVAFPGILLNLEVRVSGSCDNLRSVKIGAGEFSGYEVVNELRSRSSVNIKPRPFGFGADYGGFERLSRPSRIVVEASSAALTGPVSVQFQGHVAPLITRSAGSR